MHRRRRRQRRQLRVRRARRGRSRRVARREVTSPRDPVAVACIGMGWWSDVLADAIKRSGRLRIAACYSRSDQKRKAFADKYGCRSASRYEVILSDDSIEAIINTTPN